MVRVLIPFLFASLLLGCPGQSNTVADGSGDAADTTEVTAPDAVPSPDDVLVSVETDPVTEGTGDSNYSEDVPSEGSATEGTGSAE